MIVDGKCGPPPPGCTSADAFDDSWKGCANSGTVLSTCPGSVCGPNASDNQSKVAGEGAQCAPGNGGSVCGLDRGWTCSGGKWYKNCPKGWSCYKAKDGDQCYENGQVYTCGSCGVGPFCQSQGQWLWAGPGDDRCTGGSCAAGESDGDTCHE